MKQLSNTIKQLILILNDGKFHTGSQLGQTLNVTRSAIWKLTLQLKALGITIVSHKKQGYRLIKPIVLLNSSKIKRYMTNPDIASAVDIKLFDSLPSTNRYLKENYLASESKIPICLAEQQTAGKGRLNRGWYSPFGANIYYSCVYTFSANLNKLSGLSLVISLAIARMLSKIGLDTDLQIKWPNDILWQGKKLAGILIEAIVETHYCSHAIIGVGLNVNMSDPIHEQIDQPWTSLDKILHHTLDRNTLVAQMTEEIYTIINIFKNHGLNYFLDEWSHYDYLHGKTIALSYNNHQEIGEALGISESGDLTLKHANGDIKYYASGNTSVITTS